MAEKIINVRPDTPQDLQFRVFGNRRDKKGHLPRTTITPRELQFLKEMLFEAAFWRSDQERPPLVNGLARPDLIYLLEDWGRMGDTAVIAFIQNGQRVGAAWYRFWGPERHSFGYVSPEIPEVAIAVCEVYRGLGIGHLLIEALLKTAAESGIEKVSLSVEVDNPAINLYRRHGFKPVGKTGNSWTMVARAMAPKAVATNKDRIHNAKH